MTCIHYLIIVLLIKTTYKANQNYFPFQFYYIKICIYIVPLCKLVPRKVIGIVPSKTNNSFCTPLLYAVDEEKKRRNLFS